MQHQKMLSKLHNHSSMEQYDDHLRCSSEISKLTKLYFSLMKYYFIRNWNNYFKPNLVHNIILCKQIYNEQYR